MPAVKGAKKREDVFGVIFDLKRFSTDDGPGIRTTVFVKGCPLNCLWCHSPESIAAGRELVFFRPRCLRCGTCAVVCPRGAQHVSETERWIDRSLCDNCGECAVACPSGALEMRGRRVSAAEVVEEVAADAAFYRHSGGGVTISGGEPTAQRSFVRAVLQGCRAQGIHTALDTNGFAGWEALRSLLPFVDLFLFDLKHMDPQEHRRLTGVSNSPILRNLRHLGAAGAQVQIRVPLITGLNDSAENIVATAAFAHAAGVRNIALLPYNQAAGSKYGWLDRQYALEHLQTQSEAYLDSLASLAAAQGMEVQIGG